MKKNIIIKALDLSDLSWELLKEIEKLLEQAFHESHMYISFMEDIKKSHEYFKVFMAFDDKIPVGIVVLEDKVHKNVEYYSYPPVHLKRFTVHPDYRSYWIWKMLIDNLKNYAFGEYGLSVIFWQSNEAGAIWFYLREWALFSLDIIGKYSRRNSYEENISFFKEFITNKKFKKYRYPEWNWLNFIYVQNDEFGKEFWQKTFKNQNDIFSIL